MNEEMTAGSAAHVAELIARLRAAYPDAHCALDYETPMQLLVATILSAQCTDERVNLTTPALFARYPTVEALAAADPQEMEALVWATGFYRQKARYIRESAARLLSVYGGEVPTAMDELLTLPGVARKTANVVRGEIYGLSDGITVDTHVKRLAARLGLTAQNDPVKVERDLMAIIPRASWIEIAHLLIWHGRRVCSARKPACAGCPLNDICPSASWEVSSSQQTVGSSE
ncbi:MAG: endonuclease III [Candidatus Promineofilum sp.]|nr:endonuclease III [Promineifilum sp.]